jgi:hypothetical protein
MHRHAARIHPCPMPYTAPLSQAHNQADCYPMPYTAPLSQAHNQADCYPMPYTAPLSQAHNQADCWHIRSSTKISHTPHTSILTILSPHIQQVFNPALCHLPCRRYGAVCTSSSAPQPYEYSGPYTLCLSTSLNPNPKPYTLCPFHQPASSTAPPHPRARSRLS